MVECSGSKKHNNSGDEVIPAVCRLIVASLAPLEVSNAKIETIDTIECWSVLVLQM